MDITKLINANDPQEKNKSIIEIDNYICGLCKF